MVKKAKKQVLTLEERMFEEESIGTLEKLNLPFAYESLDSLELSDEEMRQMCFGKYWSNKKAEFLSIAKDYSLFKTLMILENEGATEQKEKAGKIAKKIRTAFRDSPLKTSTILYYNNKDSFVRITYNYSSKSNIIKDVDASTYNDDGGKKLLTETLGTKEGLKLMQALFKTKDDAKGIMEVMRYISKKETNEHIYLCIPALDVRKITPNMGAAFGYLREDGNRRRFCISMRENLTLDNGFGKSLGVYNPKIKK